MKIYINGDEASFALEKEKTLSDIFAGLSRWAEEEESLIAGLEVNGKSADLPLSVETGALPLDAITELALRVERKKHELEVIREYFGILDAALRADDNAAIKDCLGEYPYIRAGLETHVRDIFAGQAGKTFASDALLLAAREENAPYSQTEKNAMAAYVRAAILVVDDRLREALHPEKEAALASRLLCGAKPALENVPVLLQAGKDREAMQCILSFTELALKAIRLLARRTGSGDSPKEFCGEFNGILNELSSAFELRDSVLIGDLFEYEIAPRTDRLAELLAGGQT